MSRLDNQIKQAVRLYKNFRGYDPDRIIILPDLNIETAIHLGKLIGVIYENDREQKGKLERFIHHNKRPYPELLADTKTHRLFTDGGRMRVTKHGLIR